MCSCDPNGRATIVRTNMKDISTPVGTSPKKPIAELRIAAEAVVLDVVRQKPNLHFTMDQASSRLEANRVRRVVGMSKADTRDVRPVIAAAVAALNKRLRTFKIKIECSNRSN